VPDTTLVREAPEPGRFGGMGKNARLKKERKIQKQLSSSEAPAPMQAPNASPSSAPTPVSALAILLHVLLLCGLTFVVSIFPIESEDIFSNIVTGEYLWTHRSIPEFDPFSFTGPHRWLLNRPLPSLIFYLAHSVGGLPAVQTLCALILCATYSILYVAWARRLHRPLLAFSLAVIAILASCYWFQTRIYVFAYLWTAISLLLITSPNQRAMLWMIPLQVLWINSHPSAILGIFFTGMWWFSIAWRQRGFDRYATAIFAGVVAANVASPIGLRSFPKFINELLAAHPSRANIFEWFSPFSATVSSQHLAFWFYGACVLMAVLLAYYFLTTPRVRTSLLLLPICLALFLISMKSGRHIPLFYFAFYCLLVTTIAAWLDEHGKRASAALLTKGNVFAIGVTICLIGKTLVMGYWNGSAHRSFSFSIDQRKFPEKPIQILQRAKLGGNIFSDYDTGSYFLYRMYPNYKVYIDGARLDEVYGEEGFMHYMRLGSDQQTLEEDIKKYDIRAFIIPLPPSESEIVVPHRFLSSNPEWRLAYFDDVHMLFVKRVDAEHAGIPTYKRLSPFASMDTLIKKDPLALGDLNQDLLLGDRITPDSIAFLITKRKLLRLQGREADAQGVTRTIKELCSQKSRSPVCALS